MSIMSKEPRYYSLQFHLNINIEPGRKVTRTFEKRAPQGNIFRSLIYPRTPSGSPVSFLSVCCYLFSLVREMRPKCYANITFQPYVL